MNFYPKKNSNTFDRTKSFQNAALCNVTPGETEYEWKKTEQVPIQLPNIARTLFDAKKIIKKNFLAWTSEIIQFIRFENHMDGPG